MTPKYKVSYGVNRFELVHALNDLNNVTRVAAIAPWFCLHLPSCGPGFESQAHHLCFFQFILLKLYRENDENKQKEARIGPFFQKKM